MVEKTHVFVSTVASRKEIESVRSAFAEIGTDVEIEPIIPPQGFEVPWVVVVDLPVKDFLVAIAGGAGWTGLQALFRWLNEVHEPKRRFWQRKREPRKGQLVARPPVEIPRNTDPDHRGAVIMGWIGRGSTGTELSIPSDLPDEGFRLLNQLDVSEYPNHYIYWDPDRGEWGATEKEAPPADNGRD